MLFNPQLDNQQIIDAIKIAVNDLREVSYLNWHKTITHLNVSQGEIETGNYYRVNEVGAKFRAEIDREYQLIRLYVKGASVYYKALPLQDGLREIQTAVTCRLKEAEQFTKRNGSQH